MIKYKVFHKLLIMLVILLIPTTFLFAYSNQVSKDVVKKTLEDSSSKQLEFTVQRIEQSLRQLEKQTLVLANDSTMHAYASSLEFAEYLDHLFMRKTIQEKLELQSQAEPLIKELTIYWPSLQEAISTSETIQYNQEELVRKPKNQWYAERSESKLTFRLLLADTSIITPNLSNIISIVETTLSSTYLNSILTGLEESGNGKSFFYFSDDDLIGNTSIDGNLLSHLKKENVFEESTSIIPKRTVFDIEGVEYLVQSMQVPSIGGILVNYIELDMFLKPLQKVNWLVNGSLLFLFITGITFSYMFFRHFRMPFGYLVRKIENLGKGDYTSRATLRTNNEFDYLFDRFNDMASRTQSLIENVYEEKVRTQEAEYKHLQSQINPHFLYNCLFYIVSMANKSPEAVISMAKNLADFYRYITRKAGGNATLEDELRLVRSYLEVQSLRNKRLTYTIDIPSSMLSLSVPSLMLQPIIENAIVHGIEQKQDAKNINVMGYVNNGEYIIQVDDDGIGMSEKEINSLNDLVQSSYQTMEETGCGLRNVHHRLIHRYGDHSGLFFSSNEWGGFSVTLKIANIKQEDSNERLTSG